MWSATVHNSYSGLAEYASRIQNKEQRLFIFLFLVRYLRLVGNTVAHWLYKSKPIPDHPSYSNQDVTIILPTISTNMHELQRTIRSMLNCNPSQMFLVTTDREYDSVQILCNSLKPANVTVLKSDVASKRIQVSIAIPKVKTLITIMVDDDVTWPNTIIPWILAPFEDMEIGAVGTSQRVRRLKSKSFTAACFNWLGAAYIERRNFEISATHAIDGGTSCMSGRTCAIRTEILQELTFLSEFVGETWNGRLLNADDDNFITRWLVSKKWKTWIQYHPDCEVETTLENNPTFFVQCLRWARSNWRSNWTSLVLERHVWGSQPWSTYALHLTTFINFAVIVDPLLIWLCFRCTTPYAPWARVLARVAFGTWWLATKSIKLVGLYRRDITNLWFFPVALLFGYVHSFVKLYAVFTLHKTGWGSR